MVAGGSSSNISAVSATPTYTADCPNLSPELMAVLSATTQALLARICEGDQANAQFTNAQIQAIQNQLSLLSGETDLAALEQAVAAIQNLVDPDGDGTLEQLFAPLNQEISNAKTAAQAALQAATQAQTAATAAQQTATQAQTAATTAQQTATQAQTAATTAQQTADTVSDLLGEVVEDVNEGFANLQAAYCAENKAIQTALQTFVNQTLPELLAVPCEMPAPVVGPGSDGDSGNEGVTDPSQLV